MTSPAETMTQTRPAVRHLRSSALRRSALQRLGYVAVPATFLWLAVFFALDLWR